MNRTDASVLTGLDTSLCLSLDDDHDVVLGQVGGRQLVLQAAGRTWPVTPPVVGTTAYDVCAVDDQNVHQASVRICPAQVVS